MPAPTIVVRMIDHSVNRSEKFKVLSGLKKTALHIRKNLKSFDRKIKRLEDSLLPTALQIKPESLDFGYWDGDRRNIASIKTVAQRLRESRQLCGHTHIVASKLLGVTPADLMKAEKGTDCFQFPLWFIKNAAEVYQVPIDFLFGLITDFDICDPEAFKGRKFLASLQQQQFEEFTSTTAELLLQQKKIEALSEAVAAFGMSVQHLSPAIKRFAELNPGFYDMKGGAPVLRQLKEAEKRGQVATNLLTRNKCLVSLLGMDLEEMAAHFSNYTGTFENPESNTDSE